MTFAQGLFDGQLRSKLRAIVACPHCVPLSAGGNGKCFPSNLFNEGDRREFNEMRKRVKSEFFKFHQIIFQLTLCHRDSSFDNQHKLRMFSLQCTQPFLPHRHPPACQPTTTDVPRM